MSHNTSNLSSNSIPALLFAAIAIVVAPYASLGNPATNNDTPTSVVEIEPETEDLLFSFNAVQMDLQQALALFAEANDLNIVPDSDIAGSITINFRDLPLDLAMHAILDAHGFYFVKTGNLIRVRNLQTRIFNIDYIHSARSSVGTNDIQFSSRQADEAGSSVSLSQNATITFWENLDEQLKSMVTEKGSYTVNSLAGVVSITDRYSRIQEIAAFLEQVTDSVSRQIELEVEIYEVALDDQFQLGIDWERVSQSLDSTITGNLVVRDARFTAGGLGNSLTINHDRGATSAVLEALSLQGELKVVSKPKLRTLNNQPAVIRVGQDLPVFRQSVIQAPGDPPIITVEEDIENVTIGTVLSITPQISSNGMITLDISPAISRLLRNEISAVTGASAPVIDVRQASSIVRAMDGSTVVLGGLVQEQTSTTERRIPVVSRIPLLGKAFTGTQETESSSELVIILKPRLVD